MILIHFPGRFKGLGLNGLKWAQDKHFTVSDSQSKLSPPPSNSYLVVHLLGAIEHVDHLAKSPAKIFGGLGLAGTGWARGCSAHHQMQRLRQRDVAAIGQGCDDQSRHVAEVLVSVDEARVADVGEAVALLVVPPVWSRKRFRLPCTF